MHVPYTVSPLSRDRIFSIGTMFYPMPMIEEAAQVMRIAMRYVHYHRSVCRLSRMVFPMLEIQVTRAANYLVGDATSQLSLTAKRVVYASLFRDCCQPRVPLIPCSSDAQEFPS